MARMMYQAIVTKYLGPTNFRGGRVKATAEAGSITLFWDCSLNSDANHRRAAEALAARFGWIDGFNGTLHGGGLPNQTGYAFVFEKRV
jgi:hypothetical protein